MNIDQWDKISFSSGGRSRTFNLYYTSTIPKEFDKENKVCVWIMSVFWFRDIH